MQKNLSVHKQVLAERDLIEIWQYTMLNWGEAQADTYLDEIDLAISRIAKNPHTYPERVEFDPPVRFCACHSHLIVYLLDASFVRILRVLHNRMDVAQYINVD